MTGGYLLCLDTSGDAAVALTRDGEVLGSARSESDRRHVETLAPMIAGVLSGAGIGAAHLDAVVVGTGPAPFTGLRVGIATARALARGAGIDAHGVCSLEAIALRAGIAEVLVVTDAKRREVYFARYRVRDGELSTVAEPSVATPADVAAEHGDLIAGGAVRGPAVGLYPDTFGAAGGELADAVDPAVLGELAAARLAAGQQLPLTPLYLRRPDVHAASARKRASASPPRRQN